MDKRFFTCAICKQTFEIDSDWSDEDAENEFKQFHPNEEFIPENLVQVCDECLEKYLHQIGQN